MRSSELMRLLVSLTPTAGMYAYAALPHSVAVAQRRRPNIVRDGSRDWREEDQPWAWLWREGDSVRMAGLAWLLLGWLEKSWGQQVGEGTAGRVNRWERG